MKPTIPNSIREMKRKAALCRTPESRVNGGKKAWDTFLKKTLAAERKAKR
jgi:hypothetical protein